VLEQTLHRVAEHTLAYPFKTWGFGEAIAMLGLLAASRATGDPRHQAGVEARFVHWRATRGDHLTFADHVTPGVPLLLLARADAAWMPAALALGELYRTFPTQRDVPIHRPDLEPWRSHIWVDCLYTDGAFLALLARMTGDRTWDDLACRQALAYISALWDERSGLFFHGYDAATGRANDIRWGRGNGWALLGLVDLLRFLRDDHPSRPRLLEVVRRQIEALLALQDPGGTWHTVLDHRESYLETSIAAMMAWAIPQAVRQGIASRNTLPAAARAFEVAIGAVAASGGLTGVSEATPATDFTTYATRPTGVYPWGQGPMLLALADRLAPDCLWEGLP
jgi:rhamnogalacturonyl hydrolase YesR